MLDKSAGNGIFPKIKNKLRRFFVTASLEELEKRLRVVEDIEQIRQLHFRYLNAFGVFDVEEMLDCFAEDATADVRPTGDIIARGKSEVTKLFNEVFGFADVDKTNLPMDARFAVHPIITVDGDRAKGKLIYYHLHSHPRTNQSLFWIQGKYDVEYIRENGQWKFYYLKWRASLGQKLGTPPYE